MEKRLQILIFFLLFQLSYINAFNHDYSHTWVTKMLLAVPDKNGGSDVRLTFEQALEIIRQSDNLSLGVPKIVYLVGWQYNGHDDKYPAFFEVNEYLKRDTDVSARESLRWLIREARKYNTTVSLHINVTDAYDDSPLWPEYVVNDLISKNADGSLKVIGVYNGRKAYQINYRNEWEAGYTQMRIDRLLDLLPELQESGTIHADAWIARPSEGHNETVIVEAEYQKKAAAYWKAKGLDITSEWMMDYMVGIVPYAWHFNGAVQNDYLRIPANVYTGTGLNPDIRSSDHDLGFLFGTSCYGEPIWKIAENYSWQPLLTEDFMLKCPQYFYLNSLERLSVEGEGKNRVSLFSGQVSVSLSDSTVRQKDRILRNKNTICIPVVWRDDEGVIVYSQDTNGRTSFDIPYLWGNSKSATVYKVTAEGLQEPRKINIANAKMVIDIIRGIPYYVIPECPVH
ncbi:hypothetical protein DXA15_16070 [Parabacteroides sp. AM58-2XD]|uniref:endo-alpha-N-acetylgalactosaminidase family protein n=2 Tax=Parabacteroides TaxID=375288 RepID=UPI000FE1A4A3|nr:MULTISPECIES: endo-alpha-N-acetylgalactosaminidase family protein [Parabacteroides]RGY95095.1 hypothetical protein DXA15_16070 [Parabacteroides sp. AM58-2XD]GKG75584.1 hypothetical protein CE91St1_47270 [Parabacteroides goldsteinii]GKG81009.1 hypothetical protein CE91St2_42010 [Parabacteroides goldsteinii]